MRKGAYMKNLLIYLLFLTSLTACAGASSGHEGCSLDGNLCIGMQIEEPILFGDSNIVAITVSSKININNLVIYLYSFPNAQIKNGNEWVEYGTSWQIDIEANQSQKFTKYFLLPEKDGFYDIISSANTPQLNAIYSLVIHQQLSGSVVHYANTPIPYTQGPLPTIGPELLETLQAVPTPTHRSTITPAPTKTSAPTSVAYPEPPTPPGEGPIVEPYP